MAAPVLEKRRSDVAAELADGDPTFKFEADVIAAHLVRGPQGTKADVAAAGVVAADDDVLLGASIGGRLPLDKAA